jgi:hypothetical protein
MCENTIFQHSMSRKFRHTVQKKVDLNVNHRTEIWAALQELQPVLPRDTGVFFYWISLILFPFACISILYL